MVVYQVQIFGESFKNNFFYFILVKWEKDYLMKSQEVSLNNNFNLFLFHMRPSMHT